MIRENFKGTSQLIKLLFKQHRLKIFCGNWYCWNLYCSRLAIRNYTIKKILWLCNNDDNPAMIAMLGSGYETESFNLGAYLRMRC